MATWFVHSLPNGSSYEPRFRRQHFRRHPDFSPNNLQEHPTSPNKPHHHLPTPNTPSTPSSNPLTSNPIPLNHDLRPTRPPHNPLRHALDLRRARTADLESLPNISLEQRMHLRDVLGYDNWPTHFQTHTDFHTHFIDAAEPGYWTVVRGG